MVCAGLEAPRVERDLQGGSCFQLVELQLLQIHKIHPKLWIFKVFQHSVRDVSHEPRVINGILPEYSVGLGFPPFHLVAATFGTRHEVGGPSNAEGAMTMVV